VLAQAGGVLAVIARGAKAHHNHCVHGGEKMNPLSQLHPQAVQSNGVYLPQEVLLVSISSASRQINAVR
jgi:hypothetical protein